MKISELLKSGTIVADLRCATKTAVLSELTDALHGSYPALSRNTVLNVLLERERLGSTGIGDGVAIPHGKLGDIDELLLCFGRSRDGVDFDSIDGKPAHLFFLLIAPEDSVGIHLKTLARISKLLKESRVRSRLISASSQEDIVSIISEEESQL